VGAIAYCLEHGVPRDLVTPLLPHNVGFGDKGHGKAPAVFNTVTQRWEGHHGWEHGGHDPNTILRNADAAGGNCGLIMGVPCETFQFLAGDVDLNDGPNAVKWRNNFLTAFQRVWEKDLLVRETIPYRALLLFTIPVDADGGAKKVISLEYTDPKVAGSQPEYIGKIEVLARGQQAAIAGTHESGNKMLWFRQGSSGPGNERLPAPPVKGGVTSFASFDDAVAAVLSVLDQMAPFGFTWKMHSLTNTNGPPSELVDLAAPSVAELTGLLDQTPNPRTVGREVYIDFMHAVSGARSGLKAVKGALSQQEEDDIADAVARWATRWSAPNGQTAGSFDDERAKWCSDVGQPKDTHYAGWRHVMLHAQSFGAPEAALFDLAMSNAQAQFTADPNPPPMTSADIPGDSVLSKQGLAWRRMVNPSLALTTDFAVSERLAPFFSGNAVHIPGLGNWLVWDGLAGWKSDDVTSAKVQVMIQDRLWWYCGTYGAANPAIGQAGWGATTHDKMMSAGKLNRVSDLLKGLLAKPVSAVDLGFRKLQTPRSMYDLETLQPIEVGSRKGMLETRATGIEPSTHGGGSTPLFDMLILGLCDGNREVAEWLLHYIGYCMLGSPGEAIFVVVWGAGGNGKSTLANVIQRLLGSYAVSIDAKVIQESGRNQHPASLNRLRNKRIATISELTKGEGWNERVLKQITGNDEIEARDMNKNPTPFRSQAGLIIFSNDKPPFERADPAIQRRFRLINTVIQRPEGQRILHLEDRIISEEGPAVLRKIMEYAQRVHLAGRMPKLPAAMRANATETLSENDPIFGWLQAECEYNTPETANEEWPIDDLRKRCEAYIARGQKDQGGGFAADKLVAKDFLARLRREGISLEDPTSLDQDGRPRRHRRKAKEGIVYVARGIRLKIRGVA
jgi:P4 family phage/plasmid primase-like protien